jgi:hypothetical protein
VKRHSEQTRGPEVTPGPFFMNVPLAEARTHTVHPDSAGGTVTAILEPQSVDCKGGARCPRKFFWVWDGG